MNQLTDNLSFTYFSNLNCQTWILTNSSVPQWQRPFRPAFTEFCHSFRPNITPFCAGQNFAFRSPSTPLNPDSHFLEEVPEGGSGTCSSHGKVLPTFSVYTRSFLGRAHGAAGALLFRTAEGEPSRDRRTVSAQARQPRRWQTRFTREKGSFPLMVLKSVDWFSFIELCYFFFTFCSQSNSLKKKKKTIFACGSEFSVSLQVA